MPVTLARGAGRVASQWALALALRAAGKSEEAHKAAARANRMLPFPTPETRLLREAWAKAPAPERGDRPK